jgi:hypothetical protein
MRDGTQKRGRPVTWHAGFLWSRKETRNQGGVDCGACGRQRTPCVTAWRARLSRSPVIAGYSGWLCDVMRTLIVSAGMEISSQLTWVCEPLGARSRSMETHAGRPLTYPVVCEVDLLRIGAGRGNDPVLKQHVLLGGGGAGRTDVLMTDSSTSDTDRKRAYTTLH